MSLNPVNMRGLIRGVTRRLGRTRRPRTAFVLSGGASLGALQVGMLRALYERGIVPDFFVGASAGALNAAFVACRPQTVDTIDELARLWCTLRREDVFPFGWRALVAGLAGNGDYLVGDHGLRELARRHLYIQRIEEAVVPLHLVTFDLVRREEVLISRGPALDAVLAAAAIPGLLPPVRWGTRRLIDGGVVNNTPISHAVALGAERVYVLPTAVIAGYEGKVDLVVMPAPNSHHVQPTDFRHSQRLIEGALTAAREFLGSAAMSAA